MTEVRDIKIKSIHGRVADSNAEHTGASPLHKHKRHPPELFKIALHVHIRQIRHHVSYYFEPSVFRQLETTENRLYRVPPAPSNEEIGIDWFKYFVFRGKINAKVTWMFKTQNPNWMQRLANPPVGVTCHVLIYALHSDFQASAAVTTTKDKTGLRL